MSCDIFISYAREDFATARELVRLCEDDNWKVWWDRDIEPGLDFAERIQEALKEARCAIVVWSMFSANSPWVKVEARYAMEREILVPVVIDRVELPFLFSSLNTIDLQGWPDKKADDGIARLRNSIRTKIEPSTEFNVLSAAQDSPTLSYRVADRVLQAMENTNAKSDDAQWRTRLLSSLIEIATDIAGSNPSRLRDREMQYCIQIGAKLESDQILTMELNDGVLQSLVPIGEPALSGEVKKKFENLMQKVWRPRSNFGLSNSSNDWLHENALCLPLSSKSGHIRLAWFHSQSKKPAWNEETQESLFSIGTAMMRQRRSGKSE